MSMNTLRHRQLFTARLSVGSVWYIISKTSHERTVKFWYWRHCTNMVWHVNQMLPVSLISRYKNQILVKLNFYFNQFIHNNPMLKLCFSLLSYSTVSKHHDLLQSQNNNYRSMWTANSCLQKWSSYLTHVFKWFKWFRDGQKDSEDEPICRQQSPAQNLKLVVTFDELDATDCQINLNYQRINCTLIGRKSDLKKKKGRDAGSLFQSHKWTHSVTTAKCIMVKHGLVDVSPPSY